MGGACCKADLDSNVSVQSSRSKASRTKSFRGRIMQVHPTNRDVFKYYEIVDTVGQGSISTIWSAKKKKRLNDLWSPLAPLVLRSFRSNGRKSFRTLRRSLKNELKTPEKSYALKCIQTDQVEELFLDEMRNEVKVLKHLDHPNIVRVFETFVTKWQIYIVMELLSGGDLYTRVPYTEGEAAGIVSKLLSAVQYMHKSRVVHRDLKFENILFENTSPDAEIKIVDFGLAKKFMGHQFAMTDQVGTVYTMAPQVLQGIYTAQADMWSLGVITYMLLSGKKPFWGKTRKHIVDKIMRCSYNFEGETWAVVSQEAKDFVTSLLQLDPGRRADATAALKSPWLDEERMAARKRVDKRLMEQVGQNLVCYAREAKFKKLALMIIAHKSTSKEIMELRDIFAQYDSNHDGTISYKEFEAALSRFEYPAEEVESMFQGMDVNETGVIDYTEFLAATLETQGLIEDGRIIEAFNRFDIDRTGYISKQNLIDVLGRKVGKDLIDSMVEEVDLDKDGRVSYQEFLALFRMKKREEMRQERRRLFTDGMTLDDDSGDLLDENAFIPGGRRDLTSASTHSDITFVN